MDYALLCADSLFTVGVTEEERDTTSEMVATPECTHIWSLGAKWWTQPPIMSQLLILSKANTQLIFMNQVKSQLII